MRPKPIAANDFIDSFLLIRREINGRASDDIVGHNCLQNIKETIRCLIEEDHYTAMMRTIDEIGRFIRHRFERLVNNVPATE